jgi:hypothetical protein
MLALPKACHYVAFLQECVDTPANGRPSLFGIDSINQMETFSLPRFVNAINTKSVVKTYCKRNLLCNYFVRAVWGIDDKPVRWACSVGATIIDKNKWIIEGRYSVVRGAVYVQRCRISLCMPHLRRRNGAVYKGWWDIILKSWVICFPLLPQLDTWKLVQCKFSTYQIVMCFCAFALWISLVTQHTHTLYIIPKRHNLCKIIFCLLAPIYQHKLVLLS